jgi:LPS O-antigen subunit length determinant protein (WzzB/FepE family)
MAKNEHHLNYEIDLRELLVSIASRKKFIIGFTAIVTVLAILYALSITPTYKASISFLSPSQSSALELNKIKLNSENSENSETIYKKFLNKIMSREFQRKVFNENDYLAKLNPKNEPIYNVDSFFYGFSNSINLISHKAKKNVGNINFENPIEITIEGNNAQVIENYLNDLASSADKETIDELLSFIEQKITIRLEEISKEIQLLEKQHNLNRNNTIQELLYHLSLAKELGIKENNLGLISNEFESSLSMIDPSNYNTLKLPKWYLLGEDALTKQIELLKDNKYSYNLRISTLEIEKIKLESIVISNTGINSMQLNQHAFAPNSPIKPNKRSIVSVAAVAGFILSILLALLMNAFRPRETINKTI